MTKATKAILSNPKISKQRQLRMENELWDQAKRVAEDLERDVSWVIRKALEEYIERHLVAKRAAREAAQKRKN